MHACFVFIIILFFNKFLFYCYYCYSLIQRGLRINSRLNTALDILSTANMEVESWAPFLLGPVVMTQLVDNLMQMTGNLHRLQLMLILFPVSHSHVKKDPPSLYKH